MALNNRQLALIHVARGKLKLTEAQYRGLILHIAGVDSAKELTPGSFDAVMGAMERLGFDVLDRENPCFGRRPGMATPKQVQYIRDLWRRYAGEPTDAALDAWLERSFGVTTLRFVDAKVAGNAITALKAMTARRPH